MVQSAFALSIYQKSVGNVEVDISKLNQKLRIGTSLNSSEKDLLIPLVKEEFKANTVAVALLKSYNFPITNEIKAYYADSIKNLITVSELAGKDFLVEINDKTSIYHQDTATLYDMMRELTKECEKLNPKSKGGMEL
jgi:hypothetical protein